MPTDKKRIDTLISEARLVDAQSRFMEFLEDCEDRKNDLIQNQERLSRFNQQELAGTLSREDGSERNRITLSFIEQISTFRSQLSDYFAVGDRTQIFEEIKTRDQIITQSIAARVNKKQFIIAEQLKDGNSTITVKLNNVNTSQEAVAMVLKTPELSQDTKDMFAQLTKLKHRNIIKLLDYELGSFPFFIIAEYVNGVNLISVIEKTGARPVAQMIDWLYQLADALDYMRHKGVLHTNARPSKIYIDEESNVMMSPFFINQQNKDERTFSLYRDVCLYGSPELVANDGQQLSLIDMCISDQYSLGLIAYKILTGNDLFAGDSILEILRIRHQFSTNKVFRAQKLSVFPKNVIGQILKKLLDEDPKKRFLDLHEVVKVLHLYTHRTKLTLSTNIVRDSYRRCLARNRMLITDFYTALFQKLPEIEIHFKNPQRQVAMLQMSLDLLIDIDEKKAKLTNLLNDTTHQSYALSQFHVFIDVLLAIIEKNDPRWAAVQMEWQKLKDKTIAVIEEARQVGKEKIEVSKNV